MADPTVLADVRGRLMGAKDAERTARTRWHKPAAIIAPLAVAAAVVFFVATRGDGGQLAFELGEPSRPGTVGSWTTAPGDRSVPISFDDGSHVDVRPGARARVAESTVARVWIIHETGRLSGRVIGGDDGTTYRITAGPFDVRTRQARFELSWDPDTEWLVATVSSGFVTVQTPQSSEPVSVQAGQRIRVSSREERLEIGSATEAPPPAPSAPPPPSP